MFGLSSVDWVVWGQELETPAYPIRPHRCRPLLFLLIDGLAKNSEELTAFPKMPALF